MPGNTPKGRMPVRQITVDYRNRMISAHWVDGIVTDDDELAEFFDETHVVMIRAIQQKYAYCTPIQIREEDREGRRVYYQTEDCRDVHFGEPLRKAPEPFHDYRRWKPDGRRKENKLQTSDK